jgi:omega-amidase
MPWKRMRQEIFNSPYATNMFRKYAERIGWTPESKDSFDVSKTESESVRMLSDAAKEHGIWLIGGELCVDRFYAGVAETNVWCARAGSIPELSEDDKVYNSSPTFNKDGKLVAVHRSESCQYRS